MTVAAFTFWHTPTPQTVAAAAISGLLLVGLILLLVHHVACEVRIGRARRRDRLLTDARRQAHKERKWAAIAHDDAAIAEARAERDDARQVAVTLLRRCDALQEHVARLEAELAGARSLASRQNRPALRRLAEVIERDQTLRLPAVSVPSDTREVPALPGPPPYPSAHHRRRSVLASA